ncbi:hypothetical protein NtRootA9_25040 [Arthrobacter sp. NtRootA9]|nr:hypothetical protein NtRootA9_25040 [Arthrobacter sp. NtRootA9]
MVVPAANVGFSTGLGLVPPASPPPQALRDRAKAAVAATTNDFRLVKNAFMTFLSLMAADHGLGANSECLFERGISG